MRIEVQSIPAIRRAERRAVGGSGASAEVSVVSRTIGLTLDTAWIAEAAAAALDGTPESLSGTIQLTRDRRRVTADVEASARIVRTCDRCGKAVPLSVSAAETLVYDPEATEHAEGEFELHVEELDVGWYKDGVLDVSEIISEAFALSTPARIVCPDEEHCVLSGSLGSDADEDDVAGHPAFAVLKTLIRT